MSDVERVTKGGLQCKIHALDTAESLQIITDSYFERAPLEFETNDPPALGGWSSVSQGRPSPAMVSFPVVGPTTHWVRTREQTRLRRRSSTS